MAPASFTRTYSGSANHLTWAENLETDLWGYRLYRGASADFVPDPSNLISTQGGTGYVDPAPINTYYKLAAVDIHGNTSPYALVSPDAADVPPTGRDVALALKVENPARRGKLTLECVLPTSAEARLEFFDVSGRLVLERRFSGTGLHVIEMGGGARTASGSYVVRLAQGADSKVTRVVMVQ